MRPPPPKRTKIWRQALIAAILAGAVAVGWRACNRHLLAAHSIPLRPTLTGWPSQLTDRLAEGEASAQALFSPEPGLAALSRIYHANGFYNEAMQCYEGLRQLEPGEARWLHLQSAVLTEFGRLEEALPLREQAVALAPTYVPARLRLADVLLKTNQTAAAALNYTAALKLEADNPYALLGLARCATIKGDWATARDYLQQAVNRHPGFYGALTLLVTVTEHFGDQAGADALRASLGKQEFVDLADPWLDGLSADCYDAYRLSVIAALAKSTGNLAEATSALERAIALSPENASYRRQLGEAQLQAGDFPSARRHLEKAVTLAVGDADSWLLLIQALRGLSETDMAQRTLLTALGHCPQSPSLHLEYARLLSATGRGAAAIAEFRESYRLRPSEASPLVELAGALFAAGQTDSALAALHEGLKKQPDHPMILATLTLYSISIGDEAGARSWWSQVRRQTRTPPPVVDTIRQAFQQRFGQNLN